MAILEKETGPEIVLQKQYRPPIDKIVIEIPAGLVDEDETAEQAAIRELKEETGYVGEVLETTPVMWNGESFSLSLSCTCPLPLPVYFLPSTISSCIMPQKLTKPDPGFCNTNLKMVHVSVDMSLPENQNLQPELEENEFIEVFHVRLADLWDECIKLEAQGYAIDARIANLAEGIEIAKKFRL